MRLCENAISLRLTTLADLLDTGAYLDLVGEAEALGGRAFTTRVDLSGPRQPAAPLAPAWLEAHVGAGFHQSTRWALTDDAGGRFELHAHLHPYTGVYVTQVEWRLPEARFEDEAFVERYVAQAKSWAERSEALTLHAHAADDDAAQNCDNATMLRLGYGVEVDEDTWDVNQNPGREFVRGHFRFVSSWLTYVGADAMAILERDDAVDFSGLPSTVRVERSEAGAWVRLYGGPLSPGGADERSAQGALRAALGYDAVVKSSQRMWGYWQRK